MVSFSFANFESVLGFALLGADLRRRNIKIRRTFEINDAFLCFGQIQRLVGFIMMPGINKDTKVLQDKLFLSPLIEDSYIIFTNNKRKIVLRVRFFEFAQGISRIRRTRQRELKIGCFDTSDISCSSSLPWRLVL